MKARDFLRQVQKLNCMIENKMAERQQWMDIAKGAVPQTTGERVQSSGNQQRMADAIGRYVDIEKEIDACIDRLVDARKDVIAVIEQLSKDQYNVLHKIYIQGKTRQETADMLDKSYSSVKELHRRAIVNVQKIIDCREVSEKT